MREGFDVANRFMRAHKQGTIDADQMEKWAKARTKRNSYSDRKENEPKRIAFEKYECITRELEGLLGAANPAAMAATGIRTEEHAATIYGMSEDTSRDTLEIGKAGKRCNCFFVEKNQNLETLKIFYFDFSHLKIYTLETFQIGDFSFLSPPPVLPRPSAPPPIGLPSNDDWTCLE